MLSKILKVFLYILGICLIVAFVFWFSLKQNWPWWAALTILAGLFGLFMGFLFVKRYFFRRREKRFVNQIINQDDMTIQNAPAHERQELRDLQTRWQEAINLLRGSYLRNKGNPLYVLPWYLVIGESGAGKTSAIVSSRLTSPLTEVASTRGMSSTKNCDWWFFEEAIILDTAGRYTIPVDEGADREEWAKFLTLLAKYRRKEPINGLIVVISADKLMDIACDMLVDEGQIIRKCIDALMRMLGARFPVYLMVTKTDLISGMTDFSSLLPEGALNQAMGHLNESLTNNCKKFLEETIQKVSECLKDIRLELINTNRSVNPGVLIFPSEFERLKPGLEAFVEGAFIESTYQETPLLRGIFFSSAHQGDAPHPALFQNSLKKQEKEVLNENK